MHLTRMIAGAAVPAVLLAAAAGCDAGSVNTEPEKGGSPTGEATQSPAKAARVGDTVRIEDDSSEVKLSVTLTKVVDPAEPSEFETAPSGKRLVGAQFKVRNDGDKEYQDAPSNGARLIDTTGQAYEAGITAAANCEDFPNGEVRLTRGETQKGCVTFEVAKGASVERIRFGASSGLGSAAEWKAS
ncbi:DUF4352 domain-containing protein [Actinomadura luteofluorescens]|uniref:DUF4352 domain-containing protein n=1 Tax=Actinomadura luteofluorescens TaxID=46163 RepID=UPI003470AC43